MEDSSNTTIVLDKALEEKLIDKNSFEKALVDLDIYPSSENWQKFVKYMLAACGTAFLMSGIIFFFAYNWDELTKFVKLGLIVAGFLLSLSFFFLKKIDSFSSNLSVLVGSIFVGAFFAVFGQIYQTGADAYDLFLIWTLCILLWTLISRFECQWVLVFLLLDITIISYHQQVVEKYNNDHIFLYMALTNMLIVGFGEYAGRFLFISKERWIPRIFMLVGISYTCLGAILSLSHKNFEKVFFAYLILTSGVIWVYMKFIKDLYMLAIAFMNFMLFVTFFLIKDASILSKGFGSLLPIGIFVIGMGVSAAYILQSISRKWKEESE